MDSIELVHLPSKPKVKVHRLMPARSQSILAEDISSKAVNLPARDVMESEMELAWLSLHDWFCEMPCHFQMQTYRSRLLFMDTLS